MDFKLSRGPWSEIFKGTIEGFECEARVNKEGYLLSLIYEKDEKGITGAIAEVFKVLYAKGNISAFIENIPKRALAVMVHSEEKTHKFFLVDSGPEYVPYKEKLFKLKIEALIAKASSFAKLLKEVSAAYDTDLLDMEECSDEEKAAFFSLPIANLIVAPMIKKRSKLPAIEISHGEIHFGITKAGNVAKEPFDFFERTLVFGATVPDRMHALHVLAESAMLSGFPLIIFDWEDAFRGLHYPNPHGEELKKYKMGLDPVGFPTKIFRAGEELKAQVELIDPEVLIELFGTGKTIASQVIIEAFKLGNFTNLQELMQKIMEVKETAKITPFKKREAQRILEVIEDIYPGLLASSTPVEEITKGWTHGISRANILLFSREDMRKNLLVLHTVVRALQRYFKEQGKSEKLRAIVIFTASNETIPRFKAKYTNNVIANDLAQLPQYGCGLIVEAENKSNINDAVRKLIAATIGVISSNDVGIVIENRKNYRALLRPGLSDCCKKKS
ncbi:MAG: hypothetical protein J7L44_03635 [Candidatus Diapherotrites archaeon]|nr:hypothetical protein [Candidatus Diapherotrites archaeon]